MNQTTTTDKPDPRKLEPGVPCPDYPDVPQCSVACQNCRWNIFFSAEQQRCRPHTATEAARKGQPQAAPPEIMAERMERIISNG